MASDVVDKTVSNDAPGAGGGPVLTQAPHLFRVLVGQKPLAGGARHSLAGIREVVLGRAAQTTVERTGDRLLLGIPDPRMSGKHASLTRGAGGSFSITDLGSTNGTSVDGTTISGPTVLRDGALVEVGSTALLFDASLLSDPRAPLDVESGSLPHGDLGLATLLPSHASSLESLREVAAAGVPILLLGPSGAGKEVVARAVHALSRRSGNFVPVNCGALPETLLESQLFGHMKGAFSGAVKDELGFVRASDRGTLFLDEIGDMPKTSQVALLRVLQEREVTPVGATKPVKVDLRVVAATHRPVDALEAAGFRSDLYARLAGYTHRLLALRERRCDLGILVAALLAKVAPAGKAASITLTPALVRALVLHPWPLNVRELEQALSVASLLAKDGVIDLAHAPEAVRNPPAMPSPQEASAAPAVELDEDDRKIRDELVSKLGEHGGNITYVARDLGKTRMQIHRWMRRFGIDPDSFRK